VPVCFFAVRRQKVFPARPQVPRNVLYQLRCRV
jgi:hypothetical protein